AKSCGFPNGRNYKTVIINREKIIVLLLVAPQKIKQLHSFVTAFFVYNSLLFAKIFAKALKMLKHTYLKLNYR
ncbi:hypothetical protein, partial [Parabacteroides gordonii]|uniref:hypothetical protein n=1 Tax=Parabacteroides gordonii TaxID=574930 RepID=UPI0026EF0635